MLGSIPDASPLHAAILRGDAPALQKLLRALLLRHASSHDTARPQAEVFYHAFVLGLLVSMERSHRVQSNREAGEGQADVLVIPRQAGSPGAVLEFKRAEPGRLIQEAEAALSQICMLDYSVELEAAGARPICRLGIAFSGKEVVVRAG